MRQRPKTRSVSKHAVSSSDNRVGLLHPRHDRVHRNEDGPLINRGPSASLRPRKSGTDSMRHPDCPVGVRSATIDDTQISGPPSALDLTRARDVPFCAPRRRESVNVRLARSVLGPGARDRQLCTPERASAVRGQRDGTSRNEKTRSAHADDQRLAANADRLVCLIRTPVPSWCQAVPSPGSRTITGVSVDRRPA
jgi:hypothetical protein